MCEYCTSMEFSTVVKRLVTFTKKLHVLGNSPCGGEIDYFRENPCAGEFFPCAGDFFPVLERLIISKKSPCAGFFSPVLKRLIISKKIPVLRIFPCAGEIAIFVLKSLCWGFFGAL